MTIHKSLNDNTRKVWNHEFTWTDKHFTPEELLPLRQQTDDLAVDAVDRLQAIAVKVKNGQNNTRRCFGRFDMYSVLKEHHEKDSVLQGLWEEVNTVPEWVDWTQIERGQEFLYRYLIANITGLTIQGFLGGTAVRNPSGDIDLQYADFKRPLQVERRSSSGREAFPSEPCPEDSSKPSCGYCK